MIRLLFVGDGERDAATNPELVAVITGAAIGATAIPWPRLNRAGRGYDRKLHFVLRTARDEEYEGIVATIDRDKSLGRKRLRALEDARRKDREQFAPLPTALGCADPHAEAWLLDDPIAVRTALQLEPRATIPNVRKVASPKNEVTALHSASARAHEPIRTILMDIAHNLNPKRCAHARETGFARFADGVETEIGSMARS